MPQRRVRLSSLSTRIVLGVMLAVLAGIWSLAGYGIYSLREGWPPAATERFTRSAQDRTYRLAAVPLTPQAQTAGTAHAAVQVQQRLAAAAGVLSVLVLLVVAPWLLRKLSPFRNTAQALKDMVEGRQPHRALPMPRQADLGELVASVNQLLLTLTEREALLRDLFDTASVGIVLVDTHACVTKVNQCMADMLRIPRERLLSMAHAELSVPSLRGLSRQRIAALLDGRLDQEDVDHQFLRGDGSSFWGRLTMRRMVGPQGELCGLLGTITDISERKRLQQFESFRSQTLEMMARDEPLDDILRHIVLGVEDISPGAVCSCTQLTPDGKALGHCVSPNVPKFYTDAIQGVPIGPTHGSCGAAAALGQRVVVESIATHPNWAPFKELAARAGFGACWSQPIVASDGRVLGTLAMYHAEPNIPTNADITIIEHSARLATVAMERSTVVQQLRASEAHFRLLTEGVSDVVWRMDSRRAITYVSPADERLRGYAASEVVGCHFYEQFTPDSVRSIEALPRLQNPSPVGSDAADTHTVCLEARCKSGGTLWMEVRATAERDADGRIVGYRGVARDISERRKTEDRLQLADSVLTHAQEGIMVTAPDGAILEVNAAFSDITGYSRDEAVGANLRLLASDSHDASFYAARFAQLAAQGRWQGELWSRHKSGRLVALNETISAVRDSDGRLRHYVALFSDITALKEQQQHLEHSAHFDALTDLPNRVLLMDRLQQALRQTQRHGMHMALVFADLDGFKAINDQYGHAVGDELLRAIASCMRAVLRDVDTLARLGGDEFVVILGDLHDAQACIPLLQRLLHAASQPVQAGAQQLQVSVSLGATLYAANGTVADADALLRLADQAMYQAKLGGKNRYHLVWADGTEVSRSDHLA